MADRTCSIIENGVKCKGRHEARGMCPKHYKRWKTYGDPLALLPKPTLEQFFWSRVNKNGPIPEHRPELGPCWLWTGGATRGYGCVPVEGKHQRSNRVSWVMANGPIPDGLYVCHHCDVTLCVRPSHLFLGTMADNVADMVSKGRSQGQKKTHCKHGHPFDAENTRIRTNGNRACRACDKVRWERHHAA